jgi:non-ribosomal peptide synthetase component F
MGQALEVEPAVSLATILPDSASVNADRVALRLGDAVTTYRELDDSAHVAGLLHDRGIQPGDRVGVMLPNTPEFARVYYGVLRAGGDLLRAEARAGTPVGREVAAYQERGILLEVDGDRPPEAVTTEVLTRLSERSPLRGNP